MSTFLGELATHVLEKYPNDLSQLQVVFPNRRAGVFFRRELSNRLSRPIWLPRIYSMEDFVSSRSELRKIDRLEAVFLLYEVYRRHQSEAEHFDKFYFWGEMILKDFEEIDQYMVATSHLFTTVRSQKELDEAFFFLDEEDRKVIEEFWSTFLPDVDDTQKNFLKTWEILQPLYEEFKNELITAKKGYNGLIYRQVADRLDAGEALFSGKIIYAGFNALTGAEESIISWSVENLQSEVFWDVDDYYLSQQVQEAGIFFREYLKKPPLDRTFPKVIPTDFNKPKSITMTGVPLEVGQSKALISRINELTTADDFEPEKTVIVLPHEYMLPSVMHAIPDTVEKLNITMGYPLNASTVFGLVDSLLKLQQHHRNHLVNGASYYHRYLVEVLDHPLIQPMDPVGVNESVSLIKKRNLIYVFIEDLEIKHPVINGLLELNQNGLEYLLNVLEVLGEYWEQLDSHYFELEFIWRYFETYAKLREILSERKESLGYEFLIKLHRRISGSLKVPFTGEPLNGLQIMGILETRNLDFDHVLVLNMNEDSWPAPSQKGSFIPYNIRRAFDMPVHDHQDAIYSYLFYRLLQRCKTADFFYNTVSEFSMKGEPSRLLQQLDLESPHVIEKRLLVNPVEVSPVKSIIIHKTSHIFKKLNRFVEGGDLPKGTDHYSRLTPSALEAYLHCRLRFYFRYVEELYKEEELQEDMDAMLFGNILHDSMEILYRDHLDRKKTPRIDHMDFFALETGIDAAIQKAFLNSFKYKDANKFQLEGRNIIAFEIIRKIIKRILEIDKKYAPFEIIGLEADTREGFFETFPIESQGQKLQIRLKGKIDRIDKKDDVLRVVDYKTGKDEKRFTSVAGLVDREDKSRNKAAFQVLFYSWLVKQSDIYSGDESIQPGLYNNKDLFKSDFDWKIFLQEPRKRNKELLMDYQSLETDFKDALGMLLSEVWDEDIPFDQVEDHSKCKFCEFKKICGR